MERWKTIEDYPNYMVSDMGRVKSLNYHRTGKEKFLKDSKDKDGYLYVNLSKEGKVKKFKVHRLVASAFLDNPNNLPEVNHINEDKTDNRFENIEYCDRFYNMNYGTRTERTQKPILQFTKEGEFVKKWVSATQVQKELGINQSHISKCCKGKKKSIGGYIWGYEKEYERIPFNVFALEVYKKRVA